MNHGKSLKNGHLRMSVRIHSPVILPLALLSGTGIFSLLPGILSWELTLPWTEKADSTDELNSMSGRYDHCTLSQPPFLHVGLWLRIENQLSTERMQSDKDRLHPCEILVNFNCTLGPIASLLDPFYGVTSFMSPLSTFKRLPFDICPVTV